MTRRLFWENPYLYEVEANVENIETIEGKFHVTLDRTLFYPDFSGGQPGDEGTVSDIIVKKTYEADNRIIHVMDSKPHMMRVKLSINPERRLDLMQQHSGQHLLSGALNRLFSLETIGFHLGDEYATIDVNTSTLTDAEIDRAEFLCNKIVQSNFKIKSYFVSEQEAKLLPVRKLPTVENDIRVIEIDGFDFSPCGGTHLSSTGELGLIKIIKAEKYKGNIRMYFLCGQRALKDYLHKFNLTKEICSTLSTGEFQVLERFKTIFSDRNSLLKENRELKEKLLAAEGEGLLKDAFSHGSVKIASKIFKDIDFKELSYMSSWLINNNSSLVEVFGIESTSISQFLISKSKDLDLDLNLIFTALSNKYSIKGGGNSNTIQGSISHDDLIPLIETGIMLLIEQLDKK